MNALIYYTRYQRKHCQQHGRHFNYLESINQAENKKLILNTNSSVMRAKHCYKRDKIKQRTYTHTHARVCLLKLCSTNENIKTTHAGIYFLCQRNIKQVEKHFMNKNVYLHISEEAR